MKYNKYLDCVKNETDRIIYNEDIIQNKIILLANEGFLFKYETPIKDSISINISTISDNNNELDDSLLITMFTLFQKFRFKNIVSNDKKRIVLEIFEGDVIY